MDLLIDPEKKRAVAGLTTDSDVQVFPPVYREVIPLRVAKLNRVEGSPDRYWEPVNLYAHTIRAGLGLPFQAPVAGTFTVTFGGDTTVPLAYNVTASDLQVQLSNLASISGAGGVSVSGTAPYYVISFSSVGARAAMTVDATNLAPLCIAETYTLVEGDSNSREVQTIRLLQNAAAVTVLDDTTDAASASVDVLQTGGGGNNHKVRLTLEPEPYDGSWSVTVNGYESGLVPYNVTADALTAVLEPLTSVGSGNVTVVRESKTSYLVAFKGAKANTNMGTISADGSALRSIVYRSGFLDLRGAALEMLFGTKTSLECILEIEDTPPSGFPEKIFRQTVTIEAPVIVENSVPAYVGDSSKVFTVDLPAGVTDYSVVFDQAFGTTPRTILITLELTGTPYEAYITGGTPNTDGFNVTFSGTTVSGDKLNVAAYA